jgi:hypothetical protein
VSRRGPKLSVSSTSLSSALADSWSSRLSLNHTGLAGRTRYLTVTTGNVLNNTWLIVHAVSSVEEAVFTALGPNQDLRSLVPTALVVIKGLVVFWRAVIKILAISVILLMIFNLSEVICSCGTGA